MATANSFLMGLDEFNSVNKQIKDFFKKDKSFNAEVLKKAVCSIARSYISTEQKPRVLCRLCSGLHQLEDC